MDVGSHAVVSFETKCGSMIRVNHLGRTPLILDSDPIRLSVAVHGAIANAKTPPRAWRDALLDYPRTRDTSDVQKWLARCVASSEYPSARKTGATSRCLSLALGLRREGVILLPVGCFASQANPFMPPDGVALGRIDYGLFTSFEQSLLDGCDRRAKVDAAWIISACSPSFDEQSFSSDALLHTIRVMASEFPLRDSQIAHRIRKAIKFISFQIYDERLPILADQTLLDVGYGRRKCNRWQTFGKDPSFAQWIDEFDKYIATRKRAQEQSIRDCLTVFLRWKAAFIENVEPATISRDDLVGREGNYLDWLVGRYSPESPTPSRAISEIYRFFTWYENENAKFKNPLTPFDRPPSRVNRSKTVKALIPSRVLKEAEAISRELLGAAYADAPLSERMERRFGFLRVEVVGENGMAARRVSPVRPMLLILLLSLPLRVIQARLSDSGEADEYMPDVSYEEGGNGRVRWIRNSSPASVRGRQEGLIRRFIDQNAHFRGEQAEFSGFYINSNKTGFAGDTISKGYDIPWQKLELIKDVIDLREWQRRHNPSFILKSRDELHDKRLMPTKTLLGKLPKYIYLFRDLVEFRSGSDEPVTYERVNSFFQRVMAEVEDRLADNGEVDADGRRIVLITEKSEDGVPIRGAYSLHGLRVAGITAFAEAGVPMSVIAEFLAGHATILMTIYYNKIGPASITRVLDEASSALETRSHERWMSSALSIGNPADRIALNPGWVAEDLEDCVPGMWTVRLDGICPNGQTRCHDGGPPGRSRQQEVPGGGEEELCAVQALVDRPYIPRGADRSAECTFVPNATKGRTLDCVAQTAKRAG